MAYKMTSHPKPYRVGSRMWHDGYEAGLAARDRRHGTMAVRNTPYSRPVSRNFPKRIKDPKRALVDPLAFPGYDEEGEVDDWRDGANDERRLRVAEWKQATHELADAKDLLTEFRTGGADPQSVEEVKYRIAWNEHLLDLYCNTGWEAGRSFDRNEWGQPIPGGYSDGP
jgi:hypothetical protein